MVGGLGPAGRLGHPYMMAAAHWGVTAQLLQVIVCLSLWAVVASWGGYLSSSEASERWNSLLDSYLRNTRAHAAVDDIHFYLGCCGPSGDSYLEEIHKWVQSRNGTVPPSCCRLLSELPCLFYNMSAYEAVATGAEEREAVWRRVVPRVLHLRPCPALALRWVRNRAKHVLVVLLLTTGHHALLAGLALSGLYNSSLNRDPFALAPASALRGRFRHRLAMRQH